MKEESARTLSPNKNKITSNLLDGVSVTLTRQCLIIGTNNAVKSLASKSRLWSIQSVENIDIF